MYARVVMNGELAGRLVSSSSLNVGRTLSDSEDEQELGLPSGCACEEQGEAEMYLEK